MDLNGNLKNKNLIAISGKKQSGKNAIAKIINQLTNNKYEEKCFADKLKDIVCLLIGCTREQLEDEEFKNTELEEEWWYWKLDREGGYSTILLPYCESTGTENFELIKPTPRFLLQFIGTDLLRNQLHPEIWVNSLMSDYQPKLIPYVDKDNYPLNSSGTKYEYPNWIITDLRFPNELEAVKKRKGITIRVNRDYVLTDGPENPKKQHASETALDNAEFDYEIDNNKDIVYLISEVRKILEKENLI